MGEISIPPVHYYVRISRRVDMRINIKRNKNNREGIRTGFNTGFTLRSPYKMILGAVLITVGILVPSVAINDEYIEMASFVVDVTRIVLIIKGIVYVYGAFELTPESMYLKFGKCTILDTKCNCMGGCKDCIYAAEHVQSLNKDVTTEQPLIR